MSAESQPALDLREVSLSRGGNVILESINWQVQRGEHWVILGANGSGKTSLLHALLGYLPVSSGAITVLGRTFGTTDWRELRKSVGVVGPAVRDHIDHHEKVEDILASGCDALINTWHDYPTQQLEQSRVWLEEFGISRLAHAPWVTLSQGEKQKVLMGRAMMSGREILFLDEPCAGLDPRARLEFLEFLDRMAAESSTSILLVTHHVEEITPLFEKALLLKQGRILHSGSVEQGIGSEKLSELFDLPVRIVREDSGFRLQIEHGSQG